MLYLTMVFKNICGIYDHLGKIILTNNANFIKLFYLSDLGNLKSSVNYSLNIHLFYHNPRLKFVK